MSRLSWDIDLPVVANNIDELLSFAEPGQTWKTATYNSLVINESLSVDNVYISLDSGSARINGCRWIDSDYRMNKAIIFSRHFPIRLENPDSKLIASKSNLSWDVDVSLKVGDVINTWEEFLERASPMQVYKVKFGDEIVTPYFMIGPDFDPSKCNMYTGENTFNIKSGDYIVYDGRWLTSPEFNYEHLNPDMVLPKEEFPITFVKYLSSKKSWDLPQDPMIGTIVNNVDELAENLRPNQVWFSNKGISKYYIIIDNYARYYLEGECNRIEDKSIFIHGAYWSRNSYTFKDNTENDFVVLWNNSTSRFPLELVGITNPTTLSWDVELPEVEVSPEEAADYLGDICQEAVEGDRDSQEFLRKLWDGERWESIEKKLKAEGSVWIVWWYDGVGAFIKYLKENPEQMGIETSKTLSWDVDLYKPWKEVFYTTKVGDIWEVLPSTEESRNYRYIRILKDNRPGSLSTAVYLNETDARNDINRFIGGSYINVMLAFVGNVFEEKKSWDLDVLPDFKVGDEATLVINPNEHRDFVKDISFEDIYEDDPEVAAEIERVVRSNPKVTIISFNNDMTEYLVDCPEINALEAVTEETFWAALEELKLIDQKLSWDVKIHKFEVGDRVKVTQKSVWYSSSIEKLGTPMLDLQAVSVYVPLEGIITNIILPGESIGESKNVTGEIVYLIQGIQKPSKGGVVVESDIELL